MLINKTELRRRFEDADRRLPNHFFEGLEVLVGAIVDQAKTDGNKALTKQAVEPLAVKSVYPLMGKYLNQAWKQLEAEGAVDADGNTKPKGEWFRRARQLQDAGEAKEKAPPELQHFTGILPKKEPETFICKQCHNESNNGSDICDGCRMGVAVENR